MADDQLSWNSLSSETSAQPPLAPGRAAGRSDPVPGTARGPGIHQRPDEQRLTNMLHGHPAFQQVPKFQDFARLLNCPTVSYPCLGHATEEGPRLGNNDRQRLGLLVIWQPRTAGSGWAYL